MSGTFLNGLLAMMYKELSKHNKKKEAQFTQKGVTYLDRIFPTEEECG